ncbi:MAG: acyl carrier protein [Arenicellales bacterium]
MSETSSVESIHEILTQVWSEVLGVKVGPGDDFFDLGGDSVASVQAMFRVSELIGTEIPPTAIYAHPTIEELAVQVELLSKGAPA